VTAGSRGEAFVMARWIPTQSGQIDAAWRNLDTTSFRKPTELIYVD